jgi:hypothetical protein
MSEFKKLFDAINIPEPNRGFEQAIIDKAFAQNRAKENSRIIGRFGMVASVALVLFVTVTSMNNNSSSNYSLLTSEDIISENDLYGDLVY